MPKGLFPIDCQDLIVKGKVMSVIVAQPKEASNRSQGRSAQKRARVSAGTCRATTVREWWSDIVRPGKYRIAVVDEADSARVPTIWMIMKMPCRR